MRPPASALFHATCHGDERAVRQMLADGADVHVHHGEEGATVLYAACKSGLGGMVQLLLDNGANPDVGLKKGMTPLAAAADSGRVDLARLLLAGGADVNKATGGGGRPLMVACYRGHAAMVRLLLDHGASADGALRGARGGTPLISASCMGHADCVSAHPCPLPSSHLTTLYGLHIIFRSAHRSPHDFLPSSPLLTAHLDLSTISSLAHRCPSVH